MQANCSFIALPEPLPSFFFLKTSFPVPVTGKLEFLTYKAKLFTYSWDFLGLIR